jgi:TRAP-type C4-dicarboxylate transport system permease small subunit
MRGLHRAARGLERVLMPLSALALAAIMLVMVADVIGRYGFNRPIRGAYEITEVLMCVMVATALPLVALWRRHVEASLVADLAPRLEPGLRWLGGIASVLVFGYVAVKLYDYGVRLERQGSRSLFGGIPHAPFAYLMAVFFGLSSVTAAVAIVVDNPGPGFGPEPAAAPAPGKAAPDA